MDHKATAQELMALAAKVEAVEARIRAKRDATGDWAVTGAPVERLRECQRYLRGAASELAQLEELLTRCTRLLSEPAEVG